MTDVEADLEEMESLLSSAKRPKVHALLSEYCFRLRTEVANSDNVKAAKPKSPAPAAKPTPPAETKPAGGKAKKSKVDMLGPQTGGSSPAAPSSSAGGSSKSSGASAPAAPVPAKPAKPPPAPVKPMGTDGVVFNPIPSFGWDQDDYGKEPNHVYVYVTSGMDGVGEVKDRVSCQFTERSFDMRILDFGGKNYRLVKTGLSKDIVPAESKVRPSSAASARPRPRRGCRPRHAARVGRR